MAKSNPSHKLPSLDGWRAVSIVLVLICHSTFTPGFPFRAGKLFALFEGFGMWGVRFFFVISGFLISHLLLQEHAKNGFISLQRFYLRRALRILPVCFIYLLVLGVFTRYSQSALLWLANLTFTTNFIVMDHPIPSGHLWSLAVEEQFYLLWPCLLVLVLHRPTGVATLAKLLILPMLIAPVVRALYYKGYFPAHWECLFNRDSFLSACDSLAWGCLAAFAFNFRRPPLERFCRRRFAPFLLALLFVCLPFLWRSLSGRFQAGGNDSAQAIGFSLLIQAGGNDSAQAIGFSLLMLHSVLQPNFGWYRWLNWKWVSQLGILSYSIYVWQQMFCGTGEMVFGVKDAWWTRFPVWILVTLVVSAASYYLLEKPLLQLRARLHTD
jgi:peptidoglycan/LPS O-acetylase OafA/YrhL